MDGLFEAACAPDRRTVIRVLRDRERIEFDALAAAVADGPGDRTGAAIRLRHAHLPKLDALGVVDWKRADGAVARGVAFEAVEGLLAALENEAGNSPRR